MRKVLFILFTAIFAIILTFPETVAEAEANANPNPEAEPEPFWGAALRALMSIGKLVMKWLGKKAVSVAMKAGINAASELAAHEKEKG